MPILANDDAFSHHAPSWWGNRLTIFVEGAAFAILAVSCFYIWWNFDAWPPPRTHLPDLGVSTINLLVLAVSAAPILAVHLAHLLAGTLQTLLIALVMFVGPVENKHYTDARVVAVYWYFIVISWVFLYTIVFIAPRLL